MATKEHEKTDKSPTSTQDTGNPAKAEQNDVRNTGTSTSAEWSSKGSDSYTGSKDEGGDCQLLGISPPDDMGCALPTWLTLIGGTVTSAPATGQCGWIAFYAVLQNTAAGLNPNDGRSNASNKQVKKASVQRDAG